ncbi:hypothetical protein ABPG72_004523 [Tetrahymena utriculariae]
MSQTDLIDCSLANIQRAINVCQFVVQHCHDEELIQFTHFYYCTLNQNVPSLIILTIVISFVAFHLLSSTAESYLSPALAKISDSLKCSQTLAGVTLLALGNGAPDVFTAIIAGGGNDDEGINLAIGSIFGAGLFVTTVTLAKVIKNSDELKADKNIFIRDVGFYCFAAFLILIYLLIGKVNFAMAVAFFSLYFVFIIIVIYQEWDAKRKRKNGINVQLINDENELQDTHMSFVSGQDTDDYISDAESNDFNKSYKASENLKDFLKTGYLKYESPENASNSLESKRQKKQHYSSNLVDFNIKNTIQKTKQHSIQFRISHNFLKMKSRIKSRMLNFDLQWHYMKWWQKLIFLYEFPINVGRDLTIPPSEEDQWNKWQGMILCYTAPLFLLAYTENLQAEVFDLHILFIVLPISTIFCLAVWKFSHISKPPSFLWIFSIFGFINSIVWITFSAQLLVDFLQLLQLVTNVNKAYLGLTFLAFGNSAGDFFTNPQLAKMGYGIMAMTGCFAGQLFNTLLGFGIALILKTKNQVIDFSLFTEQTISQQFDNIIVATVLLFSFTNLTLILILAKKSNYILGKAFSKYLNAMYTIFFFTATFFMILSILFR